MSASATDKVALYEAMAQADPANVLIKLNLYDLYHRAGELEKAADGFSNFIGDEQYGRIARSNLAKVRLSQERFDDAEFLLRGLIDDGAHDAALYHNLGITLYHRRDWLGATGAFQAAAVHGLASGNNLRYLAFSLHQQKRIDEAKAVVQQWLDTGADDDGVAYLSVLELELGNREAAQQAADRALELNIHNVDANWVSSVLLMERQDMDRAETLLRRILDKQPKSYRALHGLGMIYYYRREFDKAIRFLNRALEVSPRQIGTLLTIGWAYIAKKDMKAAERTFRQTIAVEPNFGESHGGLATALAFQQRLDEAVKEIVLARRLDKRSFGAAYAQSIVTALQGKQDAAAKIIERALQQPLGPGAPSIEESLMIYLQKEGFTPPSVDPTSGEDNGENVSH